jgi:hypothetical protein
VVVFIINRYYDPTTDQFLSVDPKVSQTDQPYAFAGDSPLNATDPLGLSISGTNGESCISLSACSNPSVQARNQAIWSAAATAAFWAGVNAYLAMQHAAQPAAIHAAAVTSALNQYTSNQMTEETIQSYDQISQGIMNVNRAFSLTRKVAGLSSSYAYQMFNAWQTQFKASVNQQLADMGAFSGDFGQIFEGNSEIPPGF